MSNSVGDGDGCALRHTEQRKAIEPERIDDSLEIADKRLEGELRNVAIRETGAAFVVPDEAIPRGKPHEQRRPYGTCQSNSRWFSQLAVLTNGGPLPTAEKARWTPSDVPQKRTCCLTGASELDWGVIGRATDTECPASLTRSCKSPTNRKPRRGTVRMNRCSLPVSPIARRAALILLVMASSDTTPAAPNRLDQFVLAYDMVPMPNEMNDRTSKTCGST